MTPSLHHHVHRQPVDGPPAKRCYLRGDQMGYFALFEHKLADHGKRVSRHQQFGLGNVCIVRNDWVNFSRFNTNMKLDTGPALFGEQENLRRLVDKARDENLRHGRLADGTLAYHQTTHRRQAGCMKDRTSRMTSLDGYLLDGHWCRGQRCHISKYVRRTNELRRIGFKKEG